MDDKNGKNGKTEDERGSQRSQLESEPKCLGVISVSGRELGTHQIGTRGENRHEPDTFVSGKLTDSVIAGKIAGQLVEEAEKQLAYHEEQVEVIREQLHVLREIAKTSNNH